MKGGGQGRGSRLPGFIEPTGRSSMSVGNWTFRTVTKSYQIFYLIIFLKNAQLPLASMGRRNQQEKNNVAFIFLFVERQ